MNLNNFKTAVLLGGLGGLAVLFGSMLGGNGGAVVGLVLGLLMVGGSYWFSDKLAIRAARAQPVTEQEAPWYYAMVRELTTTAGIPMPRLYITPSEQPNAFATGRNPSHAAVAVTQGLIQTLQPDEIKGVLAHELAHVQHRDILISSVAAAIATGITFIARMAMWGAMFGGGRDDDRNGNPFGMLALSILAPLAAGMIQMAISRSREFDADRGGAQMMGTGEPLARALEKIHMGVQRRPMQVNPATENMYIANPFGSGQRQQGAMSFAKMFSTHPPMEERVQRLREFRPA
ncbi:MAG: zinc metalloprotease HtpX [Acidimicrobiia bacterium]|jgi:heat shock protein HtpX|nr:zinc metalloprotease HtpX [Acidimicrobiia bacterium]MBP8181318.1 zinc metalloprotease HtpX [Acidimicrobiia bacterium]